MTEELIPCQYCGNLFPEEQAPNSRCCEDCYQEAMDSMEESRPSEQEVQSKLEAGW